MSDSILETVAEVVLGNTGELDAFTTDLLVYINAALMALGELGVVTEDFRVTGTTEKWSDIVTAESKYGALREYIILKTKLAFDPPTSSAALDSMEKIIKHDEWRLTIQADPVTRGGGTE